MKSIQIIKKVIDDLCHSFRLDSNHSKCRAVLSSADVDRKSVILNAVDMPEGKFPIMHIRLSLFTVPENFKIHKLQGWKTNLLSFPGKLL